MKNVGRKDATLRYVAAAGLIIISILINANLALALGLYIAALVLIVTGMVGFCGLYKLFGIDTCPLDSKKK
jgi:hypothetical protein